MTCENTDFREEVIDLQSSYDVKLVKDFLHRHGFKFNVNNVDYTMVLYNLNGQIIGTGSYQKRTLKYVTVLPSFRETTVFAQIVTHLTDILLEEQKQIFVFTRPCNIVLFEGLGFTKIATAEPLFASLEFGYTSIKNYQDYLKSVKVNTKTNNVASIVVNCNPFTNGHKYLIEKAASENEIVYLFVVETEKSVFSFDVRWQLITEGIKHLDNVVLIRGGDYIVSGNTFPAYFLKNESVTEIVIKQAELDIITFAEYVVPVLGIKKRYVGSEDYCKCTEAYNNAMRKILPEIDVEVVEVSRTYVGSEGNIISASKIRNAIKNNMLETFIDFLPESTQKFLFSEDAAEIKNKICETNLRH